MKNKYAELQAAAKDDTYQQPEHGWTCFHCGDTFTTPGSARDHFGHDPGSATACKIKAGGERGLLMELRKAEDELTRYRNEDQALARDLYTLQSRHSGALMDAENLGYERGLRDYQKIEGERNTLLSERVKLLKIAEAAEAKGRADLLAEMEHLANVIAVGQYEFPHLEWVSVDHSLRHTPEYKLYRIPEEK